VVLQGVLRDVLRTRIWSQPDASPALRGEPRTVPLELVVASVPSGASGT